MAKHWTKIRSDVVRSTRMAALLDANPLAYALYMNAKAVCDDYGHLEAEPRKFKALACPMSDVTLKKVAAALDAMENSGVIRRYEVAGDTYLEIISYNEIEDTYWLNVGRPDYPFPTDYQPPASLIEFLHDHRDNKKVYPERYGLTPQQVFGENDAAETPKQGSDEHSLSTCSAPAEHLLCTCGAESETESETLTLPKHIRKPPLPPRDRGGSSTDVGYVNGDTHKRTRKTPDTIQGYRDAGITAPADQITAFAEFYQHRDHDDPDACMTWDDLFARWLANPEDPVAMVYHNSIRRARGEAANRG